MLSLEVTKQVDISEWEAALLGGIADGMPAVAEALREDATRCFDEERDPWGNAWAPLKPSTIRSRAAHALGSHRRAAGRALRDENTRRSRAGGMLLLVGRDARAFRAAHVEASQGGHYKIGTRDGILKGSLAGSSTATTARVAPGGAAAAYAAAFQFGDEDQEGRAYLPVRPGGAVEMPDALKTEIVETLRDAVRLRIGQLR